MRRALYPGGSFSGHARAGRAPEERLQPFTRQDALDLASAGDEPRSVGAQMTGLDFADERGRIDFDRAGRDAHTMPHGRRREMIDRQVPADALLVRFKTGHEDLSRGKLHMVRQRPGGIDAVNDDAVECGTHRFVDDDLDYCAVADAGKGTHDGDECTAIGRDPEIARTLAAMQMVFGLLPLLLLAFLLVIALLIGLLVRRLLSPPRRTLAYALARGLHADPGAAGYEFTEWMLQRPDGAQMPVWDLPGGQGIDPASASPRGTVVLLHAWGRSRIDGLARLDEWMRVASRILIPELRGHGESAGGGPTYGTRETQDLLDLMERLDGDVMLVGVSLGAVCAIRAAAAEADDPRRGSAPRIARVVALSPFDRIDEIVRARLRHQGYPVWPVAGIAFLLLRLAGIRAERTQDFARRVRVPLDVVHGTDDPLLPRSTAAAIAAAAPLGRLIEIPGKGHLEPDDALRREVGLRPARGAAVGGAGGSGGAGGAVRPGS